jgi:hypothetical protein
MFEFCLDKDLRVEMFIQDSNDEIWDQNIWDDKSLLMVLFSFFFVWLCSVSAVTQVLLVLLFFFSLKWYCKMQLSNLELLIMIIKSIHMKIDRIFRKLEISDELCFRFTVIIVLLIFTVTRIDSPCEIVYSWCIWCRFNISFVK